MAWCSCLPPRATIVMRGQSALSEINDSLVIFVMNVLRLIENKGRYHFGGAINFVDIQFAQTIFNFEFAFGEAFRVLSCWFTCCASDPYSRTRVIHVLSGQLLNVCCITRCIVTPFVVIHRRTTYSVKNILVSQKIHRPQRKLWDTVGLLPP